MVPNFSWSRRSVRLLGAGVVLLAVILIATLVVVSDRITTRSTSLTINVLSSRPNTVSGGDARIRVGVPAKIDPRKVRVTVNDVDVSEELSVGDSGLEGVVRGLTQGPNRVRASAPRTTAAELTLDNHPISGPIFSGRRSKPFICESEHFQTRTGDRLGPPADRSCTIATKVSYLYFSTRQHWFVKLDAAAANAPSRRPADVKTITMADGTVRPFIVRVETLTVDRGIAQVASIYDPAGLDRAWNRKLIYLFGGTCGGGNRQGSRAIGIMSPNLLSQGFALASNSLNAFEQNCNDVVAAEAFAMTREHVIEEFGAPAYTMGIGCAGGAAQAYQIADNYPGLLDGIIVGCSLADLGFDVGQLVYDARLLQSYLQRHPGVLNPAQQQAVSGLPSVGHLAAMSAAARILEPVGAFDPVVPVGVRFDPVKRPGGARSAIWDQSINSYGRDAGSVRARRPLGNIGVQYGLQALQYGTISVAQFLSLNEDIGGLDVDFRRTVHRTAPDGEATVAAYRTGRLLSGGGGLADIPIIDYRADTDALGAPLDMRYHTFVVESRLIAANKDADNQVRLTDSGRGRFQLERGVVADAIKQMDVWITTMKGLKYGGHAAAVESKPDDLVDACWTRDGRKIAEEQTYFGPTECNRLYPSYSSPRMVAGGPLSSDVIACRLKKPEIADYPHITAEQFKKLQVIFPTGVCDWKRAGLSQQPLAGVWQFY